MGRLICDGWNACQGLNFPVPDPYSPYILNCNNQEECIYSDINCPLEAECTINCTGTGACKFVCIIVFIVMLIC